MTIRFRVTAALVILSVLGVLGSTILILQKTIADKRSYATELNSVLAPQIRNESDAKFRALAVRLEEISSARKNQTDLNEKFAALHALNGVEAIFFRNFSGNLVFVQLNEKSDLESSKKLIQQIDFKSLAEFESGKFSYLDSRIFLYRSASGNTMGAILSPVFLASAFELSRGKDSYIVSTAGKIMLSSQITDIQKLDVPDLSRTGADIIATEMQWKNGQMKSVYLSKLSSVKDGYVLMASEKITWMDLAGPIVNSSLSLVVLLVVIAVLLAFSISGSIARPIERIAEETTKIGIGEWPKITVDATAGEVARLATAFNNMIENLKKREVELREANNKLIRSESLAAVGRIGAGIAHEVKNPLASILSYGQLLEMNIKTIEKSQPESPEKLEKIKNYNKMIMDDTRRASKIISDLLTFARQKEAQLATINVKKYLRETDPKLKAFCDQNDIIFNSDFTNLNEEAKAEFDPDQIYQVLFNLTQNATHALKETESISEKKITLEAASNAEKIQIKVTDNGKGIKEENLTKIFEPFFSTKGIGEGSGLGLAICYGIIQKHNGQITVSSKENKGTTFELTFPIRS
jgi:signal transduction histidine kinase